MIYKIQILGILLCFFGCESKIVHTQTTNIKAHQQVLTEYPNAGIENLVAYYPLLERKKVGLVINQTSVFRSGTLLVDSLIERNVEISKIYSPEHGFKGNADAGEKIEDGKYRGISVISLYGKKKKPLPEDLRDVDVLIFDIQDVGVRFYTYLSTLHYIMEAAAEQQKQVIVLDRPNPNGHYIDGPVLNRDFSSFVGLHPVPVVYGMTIGEYAQMINGEGWLDGNAKADLTVIQCSDYNRNSLYELPIKPSPNLPNMRSILLYPSLCFFEPTTVSIGRGTTKQFQVVGHPELKSAAFSFTPEPMEGAMSPKHKGVTCYGEDFSKIDLIMLKENGKLHLKWILTYYQMVGEGDAFFTNAAFFNKLAGNDQFIEQIKTNLSEDEIRQSWSADLEVFKKTRVKYLIYND